MAGKKKYLQRWKKANPEKVKAYRARANAAEAVWREKNPDAHKDRMLRSAYGISLGDYNSMLVNQGGVCAICFSDDVGKKNAKYFYVDHDHKTGEVRGLLCHRCNTFLGHARDNLATLVGAIYYLCVDEPDPSGRLTGLRASLNKK